MTSYLDDVKYRNVIPAYASLNEASLYVIERAESDYNTMMQEIGLKELAYLESTGTMIVYEGAKLQEIIGKVVQWLKDRWADIQGLFNKALNFFKDKIDEMKSKLVGKTDVIKKNIDKIKDKSYGKTYEYPPTAQNEIWQAVYDYDDSISSLYIHKTIGEDMPDESEFEKCKNDLHDDLGVSKDASIGDIKKSLIKAFRGNEIEVDKDFIIKNIDIMIDITTNYGKLVKDAKNNLKALKKGYDKSISDVKKGTKEDKSLSVYLPYLKYAKQLHVATSGVQIQCMKELLSFNMRIMMKLSFTAKDDKAEKKSKVKNESALYESSTFQTELASLFTF